MVGMLLIVKKLYELILFFQAEDGIRDLVRSRGLGDVYKRQQGNRLEKRNWFDRTASIRKPSSSSPNRASHSVQKLSLIHI